MLRLGSGSTRTATVATAIGAVLLLLAPAADGAPRADSSPTDSSSAATSTYVVQAPSGSMDAAADAIAAVGAVPDAEYVHVVDGFAVDLTDAQARELESSPHIADVSANQTFSIAASQVPPPSWGLDRLDQAALPLDGRFSYPDSAGAGVRVYVVDTGISANPALGSRLVTGYTAITDGLGTSECSSGRGAGHGTHVAGTIASTTYGVAKAATIVPVRVLDCAGEGTTAGVLAGLDWVALDHDAGTPGVVNLSLAGPLDPTLNAAITGLVADGLTIVVAAGNDDVDACGVSPASAPAALTVGATDSADVAASFSNRGPCLDLFAPGVDIVSLNWLNPGGSLTAEGTSMAAPHVAGVAALYLGLNPSASPAEASSAIVAATESVVTGAGATTTTRLVSSNLTSGVREPSATEKYVTSVYSRLFSRAPDAGGLATWTHALAVGVPRRAVADAITASAEYRSGLIRGAYQHYLSREPDAAGLQYWLAAMGAGMTIQGMEAGFVASDEYYGRAGSTSSGWVKALYSNVLGRQSADAEVAFWTSRLAAGYSRGSVAFGFLLSTEHLASVIDGHYQHLLDRGLDPSGRLTWVGQIQGGVRMESVIGGIIASEEYYGKNS